MNVLITGATGLLGKSLIETKDRSCAVTGIYLGDYRMAGSREVIYRRVDIQDRAALKEVFDASGANVVIHTAGIADVDFCERHYEAAYRSNVHGTANVIELCAEKGAKMVYVSTNAVFDGENAPYKEDDRPNPINRYGAMKLECEAMVRSAFKDAIIVRPILMYGWNHTKERGNLVTYLLDKLAAGTAVNIVNDIYDNPLSSHSCAEAIWSLIEKKKKGTYHVAGRDMLNRYDYARTIADVFGLDRGLIKPVDSSFFPRIAPRPRNTSYVTSKLEREIGFVPLALREGLELMKKGREDFLWKPVPR
jgi:dTDP-4-dehydrorhamnose reductase